jgi:hypothetical protein
LCPDRCAQHKNDGSKGDPPIHRAIIEVATNSGRLSAA